MSERIGLGSKIGEQYRRALQTQDLQQLTGYNVVPSLAVEQGSSILRGMDMDCDSNSDSDAELQFYMEY